jgi:hypothetical protein
MKKTILAIAIATLSTVALAESGHTGGTGGQGGNGPQSNSSSSVTTGSVGSPTSTSTANATTSSTSGAAAYTGPQMQGQFQGQSQGNGNAQSITNNYPGTVKYSGGYDLNNVPAVTAPNLTTTLTETCMGSSSVGGAGAGFGFSFGTTWRDTACVRRLDARQVHSLGDAQAAKEVMCESESVKAAFARVGRPCAADAPATAAGSIVSQPVVQPVAKIDTDVEQIPAVSPWHNNIH